MSDSLGDIIDALIAELAVEALAVSEEIPLTLPQPTCGATAP